MSNMEKDEEEVPVLSGLKRQVDPPPDLEDRIVARLHAKGLLRRDAKGHAGRWTTAAAAVVLLALGFAAGRISFRGAAPVQYTHILLLREDSSFHQPAVNEATLVREYGDWARGLAQSGTPISGEKLGVESRLVRGSVARSATSFPDGVIAGFFLVKSASDEDALRIARQCPHLRYGGAIELRRIDSTTGNGDK